MAATLDVKSFLDDPKLKALFSQFDTDSTGQITRENLIRAFSKFGHEVTVAELDTIMNTHDIQHTGYIDFNEFKMLVLDLSDYKEAANFTF